MKTAIYILIIAAIAILSYLNGVKDGQYREPKEQKKLSEQSQKPVEV